VLSLAIEVLEACLHPEWDLAVARAISDAVHTEVVLQDHLDLRLLWLSGGCCRRVWWQHQGFQEIKKTRLRFVLDFNEALHPTMPNQIE
jgi:hypothetical protein